MSGRRHRNATTTLAQRRLIQRSDLPAKVLAEELGISVRTVRRWRERGDVRDRSHARHTLPTTLSPAQERVAIEIRRILLLPLDDLLTVVRTFLNPSVSRSGLDRCIRRHGLPPIRALRAAAAEVTDGAGTAGRGPGVLRIIRLRLPPTVNAPQIHHLCTAVDRFSGWTFAELQTGEGVQNAVAFLDRCVAMAPFAVRAVVTEAEKCFAGSAARHKVGMGAEPSFSQRCHQYGIEHRLSVAPTKRDAKSPGVFGGRLSDIFATNPLDDSITRAQLLQHCTHVYNHGISQKTLGDRTPIEMIESWHLENPAMPKK